MVCWKALTKSELIELFSYFSDLSSIVWKILNIWWIGFGKFEQIKETGFGRENKLSVFTLGPTGQARTRGFLFLGKISPTGDKKKKNPVRPIQRILFENFQKTRHISKKERKNSPDLDSESV